MRIREVGQKAENLIEQGEQAKRQQVYYQQAAANARSQMMAAYAMIDAASETDEDGNPRGDPTAARAMLYAAQAQLASAERGITDAARRLEGINRDKQDTIGEIERYTDGQRSNYAKLQELQTKRFSGNANAFIADLAARMNMGEAARDRLLQSLGQSPSGNRFSPGMVSGGTTNAVSGNSIRNSGAVAVENDTSSEGRVRRFFQSIRSHQPVSRTFGEFRVGAHGFIKGNNYDRFIRDWEGHDPQVHQLHRYNTPIIRSIDTNWIEGIQVSDNDITNPTIFWSQHEKNGTEATFRAIAKLIPEVQRELAAGRSLSDLISDPKLGRCASIYFDPSKMPEVVERDGYYEFQHNGRHRILAARTEGYEIPVKVIGERKTISSESVQNESSEQSTHEAEISSENNSCVNMMIRDTVIAEGLAAKADFGNLDCRTSRDMCVAIARTKRMFPELDLRFVGSAQARNEAITKDLEKMYLNQYRQYYPGVSDDVLLPFVKEHVADDMSDLRIQADVIAESLFIREVQDQTANIFSNYNGITVNEWFGQNYDAFVQAKKRDVAYGYKPIGCDTPKATMDHELGHQIAKLVKAESDFDIQTMYSQFATFEPNRQSEILSGYAAKSVGEFIAESWSEYMNNPQCRECAKFVATRMIELYESQDPGWQKVLRRR